MAYKWKKEYEEKGFAVFDKQTAYLLDVVEQKYGKDYYAFLDKLRFEYIDLKHLPEVGKVATELASQISSISRMIGVLRGKGGEFAKPEQIDALFDLMKNADDNFSYLLDKAESTAAFKERLSKVEKETGMSLENIVKTNKIVKSRMENLSKSKTFAGKVVSGIGAGAAGIGGLAVGMLGMIAPLAPIAELALLSGRGIGKMVRRAKEARIAKKEHALAEGLTLKESFSPESVAKTYEGLKSNPPYLRDTYGGYGRTKYGYDDYTKATGAGRREAAGGMGPEGRTAGEAAVSSGALSDGLTMFFMKPAYKAGWTRDVLNALNKMSHGTAAGSATSAASTIGNFGLGAMFGSLLPKIKAMLIAAAPFLLQVLAGSIGAIIGTLLGGLLRKVFPQIDKSLSGEMAYNKRTGSLEGGGLFTRVGAWWAAKSSGLDKEPAYKKWQENVRINKALSAIEKESYGSLATSKAISKIGKYREAVSSPGQYKKDYETVSGAVFAGTHLELRDEFKSSMKDFNASLITQYKVESEKTRGVLAKFTEALKEKRSGAVGTGRSVQREMFNIGDPLVEMLNASSLESE